MFFTRFIFFLVAKRIAEQNGVPADVSTRDALPALFLASPIMGFVLAIALARQGFPGTTQVASTGDKGLKKRSRAQQGSEVLGMLIQEVEQRGVMVPSFIGYPRQEAVRLIDMAGITAKFIEGPEGGNTVIGQRPSPGTVWSGKETLELKLGRRDEVAK